MRGITRQNLTDTTVKTRVIADLHPSLRARPTITVDAEILSVQDQQDTVANRGVLNVVRGLDHVLGHSIGEVPVGGLLRDLPIAVDPVGHGTVLHRLGSIIGPLADMESLQTITEDHRAVHQRRRMV